jgi:hypothetical protein
MGSRTTGLIVILIATTVTAAASAPPASFRYSRVGSATHAAAVSLQAGFALMGGGDDLDEAFRWLTFGPYKIAKVSPAHIFNLRSWQGEAILYTLSVTSGRVVSSQPGSAIY